MSATAWRTVLDAWRRGGSAEIVRGIRRRVEVNRLGAIAPERAYRAWLARHEPLWLGHAEQDGREAAHVVRVGDPGADRASPPDAEFVVFIGAADTLRPGALHLLGQAIRDGADVAYADEDSETDDGPGRPFLKPAWSEMLALTRPGAFPGFPVAVARSLWSRLPGDRESWPARVLRITEGARCIAHVPLPLVTRGSGRAARATTGDDRIVQAALDRRGIAGRAESGTVPGAVRVCPRVADSSVSVLIPTRDRPELLGPLSDALDREAAHFPLERIWLDNATVDSGARDRLRVEASKPRSRVLRFEGDFNFSRMINAGARAASGDHLLLLNNDVEPTATGWIRELAAVNSLPGVAASGPLLLYANGAVQHAGIGLGIGTISGHLFRGAPPTSRAPSVGPLVAREVSALTGACLLVRRSEFHAVGGMDEERLPVSFSDVDLCLKLRKRGARILYEPAIRLVHHETTSRSPHLDPPEIAMMRSRWGAELTCDPYLPPALTLLSERPLLARRLRDPRPRVWTRDGRLSAAS